MEIDYRLILGDTLEQTKRLDDESVHLVVTSPPYPGVESMWGELFSPDNFDRAHEWLDSVWNECIRVLKPGCKLCINIANVGRKPHLPNAARIELWSRGRTDVQLKGEIIWFKGLITRSVGNDTAWGTWRNPSDMGLTDVHEYILVFRKTGKRESPTSKPVIDRDDFLAWRKTSWFISPESSKTVGHIAPFPIEIPKRLITIYSFENEIVFDPFMGSGTTLMAALMLGRKAMGIDNKPEYIALAKSRINKTQANLGKEPLRVAPNVTMQPMPLVFS